MERIMWDLELGEDEPPTTFYMIHQVHGAFFVLFTASSCL